MLNRNCSHRFFILIAALIPIVAHGMSESQPDPVVHEKMGTLVTAEWLSQHLDDPDLIVLDCTVHMAPKEGGGVQTVSGRANCEGGHIPSAGFADLLGDLCDVDSLLHFAMPSPEQFCTAMGALGVGDDSRVVLYDGFGSVWAARVWWMLRWELCSFKIQKYKDNPHPLLIGKGIRDCCLESGRHKEHGFKSGTSIMHQKFYLCFWQLEYRTRINDFRFQNFKTPFFRKKLQK